MRFAFEADSAKGPVVVCDDEPFATLPSLDRNGQSHALEAEARDRGIPCFGVDSVLVCVDERPAEPLDTGTPFDETTTLRIAARLVVGQPGDPASAQRFDLLSGVYACRCYAVRSPVEERHDAIDRTFETLEPRGRALVCARNLMGVAAAFATVVLLVMTIGNRATAWHLLTTWLCWVPLAWIGAVALRRHAAVRRMDDIRVEPVPDGREPRPDIVVELRRISN